VFLGFFSCSLFWERKIASKVMQLARLAISGYGWTGGLIEHGGLPWACHEMEQGHPWRGAKTIVVIIIGG
jgi:hypothetical protein